MIIIIILSFCLSSTVIDKRFSSTFKGSGSTLSNYSFDSILSLIIRNHIFKCKKVIYIMLRKLYKSKCERITNNGLINNVA